MEFASSVKDSAEMLYLETDPSARQPKSCYVLHYQTMAHLELKRALEQIDMLESSVEDGTWRQWMRMGGSQTGELRLGVLVAESRLTVDCLEAAMRLVLFLE